MLIYAAPIDINRLSRAACENCALPCPCAQLSVNSVAAAVDVVIGVGVNVAA